MNNIEHREYKDHVVFKHTRAIDAYKDDEETFNKMKDKGFIKVVDFSIYKVTGYGSHKSIGQAIKHSGDIYIFKNKTIFGLEKFRKYMYGR